MSRASELLLATDPNCPPEVIKIAEEFKAAQMRLLLSLIGGVKSPDDWRQMAKDAGTVSRFAMAMSISVKQ